MCDAEMLREYGLLGALDTLVNMMGEQVALVSGVRDVPRDGDDMDMQGRGERDTESDEANSASESEEEGIDFEGITYAELQFHSQALATHLFYRFGVRPGDRVIISTSGSTAAEVVTIFACLRLSAVFVPLDLQVVVGEEAGGHVHTAKDKLASILQDCQASAAVVIGADDNDPVVLLLASLGLYRCALVRASGVLVETDATVTSGLIDSLPDLLPAADPAEFSTQPLYVLFTSGSTGSPKGVTGSHGGLVNRLAWQYDAFPYAPDEVALRRTPLTFVDALAEILAPLLAGVPLCTHLMERMNAEGLASIAEEANYIGVTRVTIIPSILYQACRLDPFIGHRWPSLRVVVVSGEDCPLALVVLFHSTFSSCKLVNLYGSTEVAGDVTFAVLEAGQEVSIGKPIPGNHLFLVANDGASVELLSTIDGSDEMKYLGDEGAVGELLVVGEHVCLGYVPESCGAQRLLPNPFTKPPACALLPAERRDELVRFPSAYLTGDLARIGPQGLQYVGRKDRQVKVHGQRVELDDAERRVRDLLEVADGVVVLALDEPEARLVLLLDAEMLRGRGVTSGAAARTLLLAQAAHSPLTHALVSGMAVLLLPSDALHRTGSYKLDRPRLRHDLLQLLPQAPVAAPTPVADLGEGNDSVLQEVVSILAEVLQCGELADVSADFFSLGGDSVASIEALWRLRRRFCTPAVALSAASLRQPVRDLARYLSVCGEGSSAGPLGDEAVGLLGDEPAVKRPRVVLAESFETTCSEPTLRGCILEARSRAGTAQGSVLGSEPLETRWAHPLLRCVDASPLVCQLKVEREGQDALDERTLVFVGSHGGDVVCLDATASPPRLQWELRSGQHIEGSMACLPALGLVYLCTYRGQDVDGAGSEEGEKGEEQALGCVFGLDALTGEVRWQQHSAAECKAPPTACVASDCVFIGDYNGRVAQLDGRTGRSRWEFQVEGSVFAAPALSDDQRRLCVATTRGHVFVFDVSAAGAVACALHLQLDGAIFSTPLFCGDGLLCASTDGSLRLLALEAQEEEEGPQEGLLGEMKVLWETECCLAPFFSSAVLSGAATVVLGCHDGQLRRVALATGEVLQELAFHTALFASPFRLLTEHGERLLCASTAGDVFVVADEDGELRCIATVKLPAEIFSSPVAGPAGIFVGCRDDRLYCLGL